MRQQRREQTETGAEQSTALYLRLTCVCMCVCVVQCGAMSTDSTLPLSRSQSNKHASALAASDMTRQPFLTAQERHAQEMEEGAPIGSVVSSHSRDVFTPEMEMAGREEFSWFTPGDLSAFVALVCNNMATLLVVVSLLLPYLGPNIVFGRLVPGVGWATLFGNLYYSLMAYRMRRDEKRFDVCAQPYGINTPGAFAFVLSIMIPDYMSNQTNHPDWTEDQLQEHAWKIGIAANLVAAAILLVGATVGKWIARNVPLVPLFTSLSGIAVAYLCFNSLFDSFHFPLVGLFSIAVFFVEYFSEVRFFIPGTNIRMPASIIVLVCGSAIGWADNITGASNVRESGKYIKAYAPVFTLVDMINSLGLIKGSISIIVPTAITVAVGTIQCCQVSSLISFSFLLCAATCLRLRHHANSLLFLRSASSSLLCQMAHEAGDRYSVRDSMIGDGLGTLVGAITGSPLGMTVFIGHPGFKRMGARTGYSIAAAVVFWALCVFGLLAPLNQMIVPAAVNPILVAIGLDITKETAAITPVRHLPAFIFGLFPSLANWAQGQGVGDIGLNNMGNGALLVSMFLTAIIMYSIDRDFKGVVAWSLVAAVISFFGLMHSPEVGWLVHANDVSWRFAIAYLMVAVMAAFGLWAQKTGRVDPIRPEAIEEARLRSIAEMELEDKGQMQQANMCCACI